MRMIKRYPIPGSTAVAENGEFSLDLPSTHEVLSVNVTPTGVAYLYVSVDPNVTSTSKRSFRLLPMDKSFDNLFSWHLIGTFHPWRGDALTHVFEKVPPSL